ncbi:MAG: polysaccharide deacetylase family protein [Chitinophagales bacterium]|nr:polysaccharide deacetylase family protein [Chitinophagales bacterium]
MSVAKTIARTVVYPFITALGIERLFASLNKNNKLILVYHGVVDSPDHTLSPGPIATSQFKQHLVYFKKHFDIVSLDEIFEMYRNDHTPKRKTIAITFDDGYENNYTNAFPLLKKMDVPATIFVVSQLLEGNYVTWYDLLFLLRKDLKTELIDTGVVGAHRVKSFDGLLDLTKSLKIEEREKLMNEIRRLLPQKDYTASYPPEHWRLMNKEQLQEMASLPFIEIGAHSHNHPNLGLIDIESASTEMLDCKKMLEDAIQKEVKSIAYPDGSYNDKVKEMSLRLGYKNLLAVDYRCFSDKNDKNVLPRYCISSTTTFESNMINVNMHFGTYGF